MSGTTIRIWWDRVTNNLDIEGECGDGDADISGYQAIIEDEDNNVLEFNVDLGDEAGQVTVPPEFFDGFTGMCKSEVLAIGKKETGPSQRRMNFV